jgi:hypothetical protein
MGTKLCVLRDLGYKITMGRTMIGCDGTWSIAKYVVKLTKRKSCWCQSSIVYRSMQGGKNVKLHALGMMWGNTSCP